MERTHDNTLYKVFKAANKKRNSSSSSGRVGTGKKSSSHTNWSDQNHIPTPWDSIPPTARLNIERVAKEAARAQNRSNTKQERRLSISSPTVSSEDSSISSCSNSTTIKYKDSRSSRTTRNRPSHKDPEIHKYLHEAIQKHANRFQIKHQKKSPQRNKTRSKSGKIQLNTDQYSSEIPLFERDVLQNEVNVPKNGEAYTGNVFMESFVKFCAQLHDAKFLDGRKEAARGNTSKKNDGRLHKSKNNRSDQGSYNEGSSCNLSKTRTGRKKHSPTRLERKDSIIDDIARLLKKLYFKSFDKLFDNKNTPIYDHPYPIETMKEACRKKMPLKDSDAPKNWQNPFEKNHRGNFLRDKGVETDYGINGNRTIGSIRKENIPTYCNEAGDGHRYPQRFVDQLLTCNNNVGNDYKQDYIDNAFNHCNTQEDVIWPRHRGTGYNRLNCDRSHEYLIDKQCEEQRECMEKMAKLWEDMLVKFKDVTKAVGDSDKYIQEAVEQQRTEMTETVHLWRECMRRYELLNRDLDDKDCAYQEQVKNQKEEMHEQTKMWQDCLSKYREINENLTKLSHKISTHKTNPTSRSPPNRNNSAEPPPRPPPPILPSYPPQYPAYAPAMHFHPFYSRPNAIMRPPPMWQPRFPPELFGQGRNYNPHFRGFQNSRHGHLCPSGCRCERSKERFWDRKPPPVFRRCQDPRHEPNCTHCCGVEEKERCQHRRTSPDLRTGRGERLRESRGRRNSTPTSSGSDSSGREREPRRGAIRKERCSRSDTGHKAFEEMKRKAKYKQSPHRVFTSARDEPRRYCNR